MSERPTALVTGASRGVGAAIAHALAPTHDLLLGGRDAEGLAGVRDGLPGARPWPVEPTSVTEADVAGIDRLDVLVHSAGVMALGRIEETPAEVWRRTMEINVIAVAELTRLLLPALRAAHGHVVLINSGIGQRSNPGWASYSASKFALRAFADALRRRSPRSPGAPPSTRGGPPPTCSARSGPRRAGPTSRRSIWTRTRWPGRRWRP